MRKSYTERQRDKDYKQFLRTLKHKNATEQLKALAQNRPDNFAYFGKYDLFNTWALLPYGTTTRDDRNSMGASNQYVLRTDLERINKKHVALLRSSHWGCGWVDQLIAKVLHQGKPTRVGIRVLFWLNQLEHYSIADDDDYNERESEAENDEYKFFKDEFTTALLKYLGVDSVEAVGSQDQCDEITRAVFADDCGYHGRENAFVDKVSIKRFRKQHTDWNVNQNNPFLVALVGKEG